MAVRTLGDCGLFRTNRYHEVPDGGWGWLVAGAFFLVEVFTYGIIKSFGIFLQDLVEEFEESNSKVSWIISICIFVMTVMAPLSSVLTNRFGFQPVVMLGGVLIATGTISTAFTSSINQMYITTGVVAGLGYCLTFLPTVTLLSQYFDRRRALVTAVASMGESFAMFALAPAFAALRDHVGWRHTLVVLGALQASIIACGALLRPIIVITPSSPAAAKTTGDSLSSQDSGVQSLPEDKMEDTALKGASEEEEVKREEDTTEKSPLEAALPKTKTKLLDFSILREGSFICYSLFGLFATMGFFAPPLYIIELSVSRHVERDRATYMLSIMAVAEVLGRLAVGGAMSRPRLRGHKLRVLLGCVMAMALVLLGFTLVREFYGLAVCCAAYGFFMGAIACTHIPLLAEDQVVGIQRMASAAGVYVFIQSFAGLAGPPLGGYLVDVTGNYGYAFYSGAAGMGLGAMFLALVPTAKKWSPCGTERLELTEEETPEDGGGDEEMNTESRTSTSSKPSDAGMDEEREHQDVVVELEQNQRGGDEGIGLAETRCV